MNGKTTNILRFIADGVRLNGPKVDGSYSVTFQVGQYMWDNIKELPTLNGQTILVGIMLDPKKKEEEAVDDLPQIEG